MSKLLSHAFINPTIQKTKKGKNIMFNFPCTSRILSSIVLRWDGRRKENDGEIEPERKSG